MKLLDMTEQEMLVYGLRLMADNIEKLGAEKISIWYKREPVEIEPMQDKKGQWWACYKAGKKMDVHFVWSYVKDE